MKNEPLEVIRGSGKSCFAPFDPPLMSNVMQHQSQHRGLPEILHLHTLPLRLLPASDLRREIEQAVSALPEQSGFVPSGIGSLAQANLRFAAAELPTLLVEPLEVLSLAGSVTPEGAHLHASVSTASGRVLGGHLGYEHLVRTTAEILVAVLPEWRLSRERDPASGYEELTIALRRSSDVA
jgi:predicted DNA-binding protein with PD1-like motif